MSGVLKQKIHWYRLIFSQMGALFEAKLDELVLFVLRHDENQIFLVISIHFRTKFFYAIFWSSEKEPCGALHRPQET